MYLFAKELIRIIVIRECTKISTVCFSYSLTVHMTDPIFPIGGCRLSD